MKAPKGPPPTCPRCGTDENVVPATNFGRPTGGWWCRGKSGATGHHVVADVTAAAQRAELLLADVELREHSKHDTTECLRTLDEFVIDCEQGNFVDDDGVGYYATATHRSRIPAIPSDIDDGKIDRRFTHVCWFNK